jgi:inhibitor of KinA sporulation pathway (predicted exonuclease)
MISMQPTHAIILDFEATCDQGKSPKEKPPRPQEIIEFPSLLIALDTGETVAEFEAFVRPVHHPQLTAFCTELTSITQQDVDAARPFPEVLADHQAWLQEHGLSESNALFVTCGDWDLKTMLPVQCGASAMDPRSLPPIYHQWQNIKKMYCEVFEQRRVGGMKSMLNGLGLQLEGRHHRGIDDCRNIARIYLALRARGGQPGPTSSFRA